jgi:hypothetical protein
MPERFANPKIPQALYLPVPNSGTYSHLSFEISSLKRQPTLKCLANISVAKILIDTPLRLFDNELFKGFDDLRVFLFEFHTPFLKQSSPAQLVLNGATKP